MKKSLLRILAFLLIVIISLLVIIKVMTPPILLSKNIPDIDKTREAKVLSAFFGRDNDLPLRSVLLSWSAPGNDGMPVIFSQEVDPSSLDPSYFEITTESGKKFKPKDITLNPANEEFELRTVLMVGELGDHPEDKPISLKITGDIMSRSGQSYNGQTVAVTPLPDGPFISYAEHFIIDSDYPYVEKGRGCDCPREKTTQVVRLVWSGGVRATSGAELGESDRDAHTVSLIQGTDTIQVKPFMLADLKDNDNNIDLCLKESGTPFKVSVEAGTVIDPRDDANDYTESVIVSRW